MKKMIVGGREVTPLSLDDALNGLYGQIVQGMVNSLLADDADVATCFVNTYDFSVADGGWNPEAWREFLDALEGLEARFGKDVVYSVVDVQDGFDPTDDATWPDDDIVATFYGDFLKLFDVSDLEA